MSCDLTQAEAVVREMANLHASYWQSPRLASHLGWLRSGDHNRNLALERLVCEVSLPRARRKFRDLIPEDLFRIGRAVDRARPRIEALGAAPPQTVIHGDAHLGNLYFEGSRAGFLDWQVVQRGQGIRDVAYFLVTSTPTKLRQAHQRDLLRLYVDALAVLGIADRP